MRLFEDRHEAGRQLAARLLHYRNAEPRPVVLGLPRGGVVVAADIARELDAQLDVLVVRKIGAPHQPELALGAVTDGKVPVFVPNEELIFQLGISQELLQSEIDAQLAEVRSRQVRFRGGRAGASIVDRTVIVVDDGIATGATVRAGLAALRKSQVSKLVLAVPVAPPETLQALSNEVDEIVCLHAPRNFMAVGRFYLNFDQTTDEQVIALLEEATTRETVKRGS